MNGNALLMFKLAINTDQFPKLKTFNPRVIWGFGSDKRKLVPSPNSCFPAGLKWQTYPNE